MNINHLKEIIAIKKKIILMIFLLISLPLCAIALLSPCLYQASVKLSVFPNPYSFASEKSNSSVENLLNISSIYEPQILVSMIKDTPVMMEVIREVDLRNQSGILLSPQDMDKYIKIVYFPDKKKIELTGLSGNPDEARKIADSAARNFLIWRKKIVGDQLKQIKSFVDYQTDKNKKNIDRLTNILQKSKKVKSVPLKARVKENIDKQCLLEMGKMNVLLEQQKIHLFPMTIDDEIAHLREKQKTIENTINKYQDEINKLPPGIKARADQVKGEIISKKLLDLLENKSVDLNMLLYTLDSSIIIESGAKNASINCFIGKSLGVLGAIILGIILSIFCAIMLNYFELSRKKNDGIYLGGA